MWRQRLTTKLRSMAAFCWRGWVLPRRFSVPLQGCFQGENGLTDGASIFTGRIVKKQNWREVACQVSSAKGGGKWCFWSSSSNQRRYQLSVRWKVRLASLSSLPLQIWAPEIVEKCRDFTFSLSKCVSEIGCQIFINNIHSQKSD